MCSRGEILVGHITGKVKVLSASETVICIRALTSLLVYSVSKPPRWPLKKIFRKACLHVAGCTVLPRASLPTPKFPSSNFVPSSQSSICHFCPSLASKFQSHGSFPRGPRCWRVRYSRALIRSKNGRPTANGAAKRLCLLAVIESTHSMPPRARREQGGRKLESWLAGELPPSLPVRRGGCWLALLFALSLFFFTFAPSATVETSASACVTDPERPRDRVRRRRRRAQPPGGRPDDPEVAPGPHPDPQVSPPGRFFART